MPWLAGAVHTNDEEDVCEGVLLERLQPNEVRLIDSFQINSFDRIIERVTASNGVGGYETVDAYMYVCPSDSAAELLEAGKPWSYADLRKNHLERVKERGDQVRTNFTKDEAKKETAG
jgi:hypothetical protein